MAERESQFITMSRQGILLATAMGVGLLTFCYVIGVQVGKRSLTQKNIKAKTLDEELKELPEPLDIQIGIFKSIENDSAPRRNDRPRSGTPSASAASSTTSTAGSTTSAPRTTATSDTPRPVAAPVATADKFTAQVIALSDIGRANNVAERLKSQGIPAKVVFLDGLYKVQLDWSGPRAELDSRLPQLRALGYTPVAVRVQ